MIEDERLFLQNLQMVALEDIFFKLSAFFEPLVPACLGPILLLAFTKRARRFYVKYHLVFVFERWSQNMVFFVYSAAL